MRVELTDMGEGVARVTLPLPWALDHVHCYAVRASDGWTLIDTGLGDEAGAAAWREALDALGPPPVRRIVITHHHPDHVGGGAPLALATGAAEVVQGRQDARLTATVWGADADPDQLAAYLEHHGMPAQQARGSADDEAALPVRFAHPTRLVDPGDTVDLGGERYRVLVLPGHADGHIALLGHDSGRLFGGDVLLDEITPNVGRWPDSAPDPLGAYLCTLDRLDQLRPAVVYPGHGPVILDPARRIGQLRHHHAERLDEHDAALRGGARTAYEVAGMVWAGQELGFHERRFALVEAIAHLERLEALGRATRHGARWAREQPGDAAGCG